MVKVGDTITVERVFTNEEVLQFAEISQDKGIHHLVEDDQGRLVVHGLLTGTLPTEIGGKFNLMANKVNFQFTRPVYTGDLIQCTGTIEKYEQIKEGRMDTQGTFICENQDGTVVLTGEFSGVVFD